MAETKRGRASKPVMDYSAVAATAVEEDEPLTVQRQKEANPFIDSVKVSVENDKAYSFGNLQGALAAVCLASVIAGPGRSSITVYTSPSRRNMRSISCRLKGRAPRRPNTAN